MNPSIKVKIDLYIGGISKHSNSISIQWDSTAKILNHERERSFNMLKIRNSDRGGLVSQDQKISVDPISKVTPKFFYLYFEDHSKKLYVTFLVSVDKSESKNLFKNRAPSVSVQSPSAS